MNRDCKSSATSIIAQIQGHMELGMHKESVKLAEKILKSDPLDARVFQQAIFAILQGDEPLKKLKTNVFAAYERLNKAGKKLVQTEMLAFAWTVKEFKLAQNFIPVKMDNARTLYFAVETCLENKSFRKAKKLANHSNWLLNESNEDLDDTSRSFLLSSLAGCAERFGDYDLAEKCWLESLGLDEPLFPDAALGLIKTQAARAWVYLWGGLIQIQRFKGNLGSETALNQPGNHDRLLDETNKNFKPIARNWQVFCRKKICRSMGLKNESNHASQPFIFSDVSARKVFTF